MTDMYKQVTDRIVSLLEQGTIPWRRAWDAGVAGGGLPRNAVTGRAYRGINVLLLGMAGAASRAADPRLCTYRQAAERGWQVRKGERGTAIVLFKPIETARTDLENEEDDAPTRFVLRTFTVFNAAQMDGIDPWKAPPQAPGWSRPAVVQAIVEGSRVPVREGGRQPCYIPSRDEVWLPRDHLFSSPEAWASVLLHELGHATGHPSRLNRDLTGRFGSEAYALEELRAEMASAFVGEALGLPAEIEGHASYLQSWLRALRNDKREIFRAATDAQRIADWLLALAPVASEAGGTERLVSSLAAA